ncbi:Ctr copper transporter family-domain-containing protein [Lipomyces oligophaga]|uniref:Ctr copper transporter family-domain-containing protein n=1 Tax=Lipomyces oligophaga TaxID=45792 RepID=UPI0034CF77A8
MDMSDMDMSGMDMATSSSSVTASSTMDMIMTTASSVLSSVSSQITSMASATSSAMDMDGMDMGSSSTTDAMDSMSGMDMGATATSSSMDMSSTSSSMDMSSSSMSSMAFHSNVGDYLFASGWTPSTHGQYAGTCIFLIVLAMIYRLQTVFKSRLQSYLLQRARFNALTPSTEDVELSSGEKSLAVYRPTPPRSLFDFSNVRPWRVSVDVPLAILQLIMAGTSYLLMLAAMTYNIGYFFSIIGGFMLGELVFGRFGGHVDGH